MQMYVFHRHYFFLLFIFLYFDLWESFADEVVPAQNVRLGGNCINSEQCQKATPNSTCSDGLCTCMEGYFPLKINTSYCESKAIDMTDEDYVGSSSPPKVRQQHVDPKMIIIMVVLAVMFVGICVALHLFSRARFRNHRTIFNSPHPRLMHIKLGKKKGRRRASHTSLEVPGSRQLSICSQLSPLQSRRGSQATSPEFCQKPRRSNAEKSELASHGRKTAKTDSSERRTDAPTTLTNGPGSPTVVVASGKGPSRASASNTTVSARV